MFWEINFDIFLCHIHNRSVNMDWARYLPSRMGWDFFLCCYFYRLEVPDETMKSGFYIR